VHRTYRIFFRRGHRLDRKSIIEKAVAWEVLANIRLDKLDTLIRIVDTLDLVTDTADYRNNLVSRPGR
jgi:hypothetical protein